MRVARFEHLGTVGWGFVEDSDVRIVPHEGPSLVEALALDNEALANVRRDATSRAGLEDVTLLAPVPSPPQFLGVGLNYADHAAEAGLEPPPHPQTFGFLNSAIVGPGEAIRLPATSDQVDWEVELAVVIGRPGKRIDRDRALEHVAGYTIVNDLSARDVQFADGQWTRGKSFDTFKPMGPWITTADELGTAGSLSVKLWVNDVIKQDGSTVELVFDVPELVSRLSASVTLLPGGVISTGTPPGVGFAMTPPEFLRAGDVVTLEIEGIGRLANPVVAG